jgi:hypothetical protein
MIRQADRITRLRHRLKVPLKPVINKRITNQQIAKIQINQATHQYQNVLAHPLKTNLTIQTQAMSALPYLKSVKTQHVVKSKS